MRFQNQNCKQLNYIDCRNVCYKHELGTYTQQPTINVSPENGRLWCHSGYLQSF